MEGPKVSIVIPTHNLDTTIARCLSSIQSQSYSPIEVVVVDNFSDDNTTNIAKTFGAKVAQTKSNPALARNVGIANSA
jgi:glycosyltransferase involved in cell wall biosynthesis